VANPVLIMSLLHIDLQDFRNYTILSLPLHAQVTRVVGENAQGKTNLLEAIFYLCRGRSFRTHQATDLIRHGTSCAIIRAQAERDDLHDEFAVEIGGPRRRFVRNGKNVRAPDATWPHVIVFAPEETLLFKGGPAARREYLDTLIEGLDPGYATVRRTVEKILVQRNRLLKSAWERSASDVAAQLQPWTTQFIDWGSRLMASRERWVAAIQQLLPAMHLRYAAGDGDIALQYHPHVASAAEFAACLAEVCAEEIARGLTLVGPQRDELSVTLSGRDLHHFGSQGQHRSVVLSLKMAEVGLVRQQTQHAPLFLLDDVTSELDPGRIALFFQALHEMACQIIVTTTHLDDALLAQLHDGACLRVAAGAIRMGLPK